MRRDWNPRPFGHYTILGAEPGPMTLREVWAYRETGSAIAEFHLDLYHGDRYLGHLTFVGPVVGPPAPRTRPERPSARRWLKSQPQRGTQSRRPRLHTATPRQFSREFKEAAVRRMLAGEKVRALATELALRPKLLYAWRNSYERGGPEALHPPGRPRKGAAPGAPKRCGEEPPLLDRVAELERKVGQQAPWGACSVNCGTES